MKIQTAYICFRYVSRIWCAQHFYDKFLFHFLFMNENIKNKDRLRRTHSLRLNFHNDDSAATSGCWTVESIFSMKSTHAHEITYFSIRMTRNDIFSTNSRMCLSVNESRSKPLKSIHSQNWRCVYARVCPQTAQSFFKTRCKPLSHMYY